MMNIKEENALTRLMRDSDDYNEYEEVEVKEKKVAKPYNKKYNKAREALRGEKYNYIIGYLKKYYKKLRKDHPNEALPNWNELAHEYGIYYLVEQHQDVIKDLLSKDYVVQDILKGDFYIYDHVDWERYHGKRK